MEVEWIKIDKLKPANTNIKEHLIIEIKESIKKFGFTAPIIISEDFEILAGHGRYYACIQLMHELDLNSEDLKNAEPFVKYTLQKIKDGYVLCRIVKDLSEDKKIEYRIVDNILTIKGGLKKENLAREISKLKNKKVIGFTEEEIKEIISSLIGEEVKELNSDVYKKVEEELFLRDLRNVNEHFGEIEKETIEEEKEKREEKEEEKIDLEKYIGYSTHEYINVVCPYCGRNFNIRKGDV